MCLSACACVYVCVRVYACARARMCVFVSGYWEEERFEVGKLRNWFCPFAVATHSPLNRTECVCLCVCVCGGGGADFECQQSQNVLNGSTALPLLPLIMHMMTVMMKNKIN